MSKSALVISRDAALTVRIADSLTKEGFDVGVLSDYSLPTVIDQTIAILDIGLDGGLEFCRQMREASGVPIIGLTNGSHRERAKAFAAGADDCMTKPVNMEELVARVTLACRIGNRRGMTDLKPATFDEALITLNDLRIDPAYHEVKLGDSRLDLTSTEFNLLMLLAENQGRAVSRSKILKEVWGDPDSTNARMLDTHVCRLRRKLTSHSERPVRLTAIKGFGYRLQ